MSILNDLSGNRTRVYAVRGRRLDRLTNRPYLLFNLLFLCRITCDLDSISYFRKNASVFLIKIKKFKTVSVGAVICSREAGELNKKIAQKPPKSRTVIREKSEQKFVEAPETAYMSEKSMIKLKKAS